MSGAAARTGYFKEKRQIKGIEKEEEVGGIKNPHK